MTTQTALPTEWTRLHKLSPLLRSARAVVALGGVLGTRQLAPGQHQEVWVDLVILGVAAVAGVVSWLVTRWRIHHGELQIETGLIRRQSLRVPLTRMQAVDVVRPLLARMLGLAEVRIVVAGQGSGLTKLAYLTEERAAEVRAQLLAVAHGLDDATPEPAERPLVAVPGRRILGANLLAPGPLLVVLLALLALTLVVTAPEAAAALAGSTIALGIGLTLATARQVGAEWEFTLAEAPDGLRLRSGLLQHRAETVPYGRAQAVRWVEPLLWRTLGWVRLEIDVARRRDRDSVENTAGSSTRALLPVGNRAEAEHLLPRVFPGASVQTSRVARVPQRAWWRAPLLAHHLEARYDASYVVCATGRLRRAVVVVPLEKVQSVRWSQGPVSRALRLATVHVDTAGHRFPGYAPFRDVDEARRWMLELPDLARAAREVARTQRGPRGGP